MTDRRIGSLPSPLATIVCVSQYESPGYSRISLNSFHFDEENGGRPCEAAFVSEYSDSKTRAAKEVVVLVS
jgi:hypothetical protein